MIWACEISRFANKCIPVPESGCWLWTAKIGREGYGQHSFKRVTLGAHRASWMLHMGDIPVGQQVLHKCDTRICVNPDHLFLGTQADNIKDMHQKGRARRQDGKFNPQAKLDIEKVKEIRASIAPQRQVANLYGVSQTLISRIKRGYGWSKPHES